MVAKDRFEDPVGFLKSMSLNFQSDDTHPYHPQCRATIEEFIDLIIRTDLAALESALDRHKKIGEDFGTPFFVVIQFVDEYLAKSKIRSTD